MTLRSTRPLDIGSSHVIVTGGSSGIGLATARLLAARGAKLSLIARGAARLDTAAKQVSAAATDAPAASRRTPTAAQGTPTAAQRTSVAARAADVADQAALNRAIAELEAEQAQPCDILITSAGLARPGHFLDLPDDVFRQMIEVDYFGTLHALRAVAPGMVERGQGSVVAVSSAAGLLGIFGYSAYGPAKFAVRGLMESVRAELTPRGVHVGVVFPPDVDTPQLAEENRWKPRETRVVGGTIKPLTAEKVAAAIVQGIDRRRFTICPDTGTRALARFGSVLMPLLNREFDRRVRAVQRSTTGT
ncbi:SDR family oxidoreductase [Streptomyces europaeiscabiei]|uniref:SDR family oxidoreductase n=1 Tax=Streptomyces europaeiscabiei TaxID=146819 RepID=UPI0029A593A2|nr:SDR family oxidoreductase [Streptomyces europaeiscabiei]MDX3781139.1 SDR family oxidoreductase [Streptomyces europaeiscabiei]MDX3839504.1 SDR family oxidoreductase [Streptomyces europaeiscabiei]MDX3866367.1 SDR family oxidoreductase [Streptomyces europaeiscabiei]MDX3876094.1 SDR family oxidoreductase [Streptomyces europaeiscabiei]